MEQEITETTLANKYDDNYYGEGALVFGRMKMTIESIWTDNNPDAIHELTLMVHVNDKHFEGDIYFRTLSKANQKRVVEMIKKHNNK